MKLRAKVGIGTILLNEDGDKVLIGKRIKQNLYGFPGGKLDFGETFEYCAVRELLEETSLKIEENRLVEIGSFNSINLKNDFHYVEIDYIIRLTQSEEVMIRNTEPHACEEWIWVTNEELFGKFYKELFVPIHQMFDKFKVKSIDDFKKFL
jgi:8-oxo-dGTP diphosphatase